MNEALFTELAGQAGATVARAADDPEQRYRLRESFYQRYGFGMGAGFGSSELAFLRWEIRRGVLNPMDHELPGSPWWRAVNGDFLYYAELATLIHEQALSPADCPAPVRFWLGYLQNPSSKTWYRAHNASIVQGYLDHELKAAAETPGERTFLGEVLYRVLYAQSMVEGVSLFRAIGRILACPETFAVDALVHLPHFYPSRYPLSPQDLRAIFHEDHCPEELAVDMLDRLLILPGIQSLFEHAALWLDQPRLTRFVVSGACAYPAPEAAGARA